MAGRAGRRALTGSGTPSINLAVGLRRPLGANMAFDCTREVQVTKRAFSQLLTTWMYLNICGAAILLAHTGPYDNFWILLTSAAASWFALGKVAKQRG